MSCALLQSDFERNFKRIGKRNHFGRKKPYSPQARKDCASSYVREHILKLSPYKSIVPFEILSEKLRRSTSDIVKLDANENPYGPPPEVFSAINNIQFPHIYPDPESRKLRKLLAQECNVPMENILVGCGADELIDLVMRVTLDPKDVVINTPPTFGMYEFDCSINDGTIINVPRKAAPHFGIDVEAIRKVVEENKVKLVILTSPNNPDGSIISREEIEMILELPVLVVLDEAYIEFHGIEHSLVCEVPRRQNLIVLRTFSKRAALAGLRIGYGFFPLNLIEYLWRIKQPYNVSVVAEVAACAALSNPVYLEQVKNALVKERKKMFKMMSNFTFLQPYDSKSNFILCRVSNGKAEELKKFLESEGIVVRYYSNPPELTNCIRVSVGLPEHTMYLEQAFKKYYKLHGG